MMEQASTKKCMDDAASVAAAAINGECNDSGRGTLVAIVQTTGLRDGDDFPRAPV